jgi:sialidase-1
VTASLISDDGGTSWQGGSVIYASDEIPNPNETAAAQLDDGSVIFNIRHQGKTRRRAVSVSPDGKGNFTEPRFDDGLRDPQCFGSLLALPGKGLIAYSGCDSETARENLTVKLSRDGGRTWFADIHVYDKAGYSDIVASPGEDRLYCFFERDNLSALSVETITL